MKFSLAPIAAAVAFAALLIGCASAPRREPAAASAPPAQSVEPSVAAAPPAQPAASLPAGQASTQPAQQAGTTITVSQDVYDRTLAEVRALIDTLNQVIAGENFQAWTGYLTDDYIATYSDPQRLAVVSQMPVLEKNGVVLRTLKDYFTYVVVPSRTNAHVDAVDFLSHRHIRAVTVINNTRYILYDLRLTNGAWKIGIP